MRALNRKATGIILRALCEVAIQAKISMIGQHIFSALPWYNEDVSIA